MAGSASRRMLPPSPPLPPSGPPRGTNFSRRKLMQPLPPLPAAAVMSTSSTNMAGSPGVAGHEWPAAGKAGELLGRGGRNDRDEPAVRAVVLELHGAGHLREQRVVLAEADVLARVELASALADEDRAAR